MKTVSLKLATLTLALLVLFTLLCSCSDNSKVNTETTDKDFAGQNVTDVSDNNDSAGDNKNLAPKYLSSTETGAGDTYKWTAMFIFADSSVDASALNFVSSAKITNANGTVVYEGAPSVTVKDGLIKCVVDYNNVSTGNTTLGTGTVTLSVEGSSAAPAVGEDSLKLLPYDMAEISVPNTPLSVNKIAGDGTVTATMEITEISKELKYRGETVNVSIHIKGKRTYTSGANDYIGTSIAVTADGKELKKGSIINKVDANGEIEGKISFEYTVGSAPVVTFGDYK